MQAEMVEPFKLSDNECVLSEYHGSRVSSSTLREFQSSRLQQLSLNF